MCGPTCQSHLLIVNPPQVVDGQDEVGHAANVEGIEHGGEGRVCRYVDSIPHCNYIHCTVHSVSPTNVIWIYTLPLFPSMFI